MQKDLREYNQLGGWLLTFVIFNIIALLLSIRGLFSGIALLPSAGMFPALKSAVVIMIIGELLSIGLGGYTVFLVFKRKIAFKLFYLIRNASAIVITIIGLALIASLRIVSVTSYYSSIIGNVIGVVAWMMYLNQSVRVKVYCGLINPDQSDFGAPPYNGGSGFQQ